MASFSLREAAEQAGTSKSTIWRAVKSGRLSAARTDDGGFAIDAAELFRAFPPQRLPDVMGQDATVSETAPERPATGKSDSLAVRAAMAEAELAGLKALIAEMKSSRDEIKANRDETRADRDTLRADRDELKGRVERLQTDNQRLLADQQRLLTDQRTPLLRRLFGVRRVG
jgi:excisionase family DNA binding protein